MTDQLVGPVILWRRHALWSVSREKMPKLIGTSSNFQQVLHDNDSGKARELLSGKPRYPDLDQQISHACVRSVTRR
jgi:hypothetical protein